LLENGLPRKLSRQSRSPGSEYGISKTGKKSELYASLRHF
jgi:hypothetical protein